MRVLGGIGSGHLFTSKVEREHHRHRALHATDSGACFLDECFDPFAVIVGERQSHGLFSRLGREDRFGAAALSGNLIVPS
jgi:hypothetical protein